MKPMRHLRDLPPTALAETGVPAGGTLSAPDFALFAHQQAAGAVSAMDVKASILAGISSSLALYLAETTGLAATLSAGLPTGHVLAALLLVLFACAALMATVGFAAACIVPRGSAEGGGLLYFRAVAAHRSPQDYAARVAALPPEERLLAISRDAFHVASIAARKERWVARSAYAFLYGGAASFLAIVVS